MAHEAILELLRRPHSDEAYLAIREAWKTHSIAEDRRDIAGLMSTLAPDCVYELPQLGLQWHGHSGATEFYTQLLTAFPDLHFDLQDIVIGPQGVCEEARATGTWEGEWLGRHGGGRKVDFHVIIFFPWDPLGKKFKGERVFFFGLEA